MLMECYVTVSLLVERNIFYLPNICHYLPDNAVLMFELPI